MSLSRGVVLGGHHRPRGLEIIVPRQYAETVVVGKCMVVVNGDTQQLCGATFYAGQEERWQRHVGECARRHINEILSCSPRERNRGTPFDEESWDPEVDAHMRKIGQRMLKDGDFEVKPRERAGHS